MLYHKYKKNASKLNDIMDFYLNIFGFSRETRESDISNLSEDLPQFYQTHEIKRL